jgi:hypothetical protein
MANSRLIRREKMRAVILPSGHYFHKTKNGNHIYKNQYSQEWYMVYQDPKSIDWIVETYVGDCNC